MKSALLFLKRAPWGSAFAGETNAIGTLTFAEKLGGYLYRDRNGRNIVSGPEKRVFTHITLDMTGYLDDLSRFDTLSGGQASISGRMSGSPFPGEPVAVSGRFILIKRPIRLSRRRDLHLNFTSNGRQYRLLCTTKPAFHHPLLKGDGGFDHMAAELLDEREECLASGILRRSITDLFELVRSSQIVPRREAAPSRIYFLRNFLGKEARHFLRQWKDLDLPVRRRRLSLPRESLEPKYDVVIVGSGYGGGVLAARLAQWQWRGRRKSVCLLERGKEWRAGDFPANIADVVQAVRSDSNPTGLFEYCVNRELDVFGGSGLGGTSLINAAVMTRPNALVFKRPEWPHQLPDMAPYLERALRALHVTRTDNPPLKARVFCHAARRTEKLTQTSILDHAITFKKTDRSGEDIVQHGCISCGQCVTGCNYSAKNSIDMNYLPIAQSRGASLFSCIEVRSIQRVGGGGFRVHCVDLDDSHYGRRFHVDALQVVVAAGVLGSFAVLSRSRERHDLQVPAALGRFFSGNCNTLGFSLNSRSKTLIHEGPTVTAVGKYWDSRNVADQFIIEEGGVPAMLAPLIQKFQPLLWGVRNAEAGVAARSVPLADRLRMWADIAGFQNLGALNRSLMLLGTGFDDRTGRLVFERDRARICWPELKTRGYGDHIRDKMQEIAQRSGGTFFDDPRTLETFGGNLHTVHPLGGCVMAEDAATGVVNYKGEVFGHPGGLYVADGSVIPSSLGVNPALTIAGLVEWFADQIVAGWTD